MFLGRYVSVLQRIQSTRHYRIVTVVVFHYLLKVFDVAVFTIYSVLMNVNDLFTHFHLFQLNINSKNMYHISADFMLNS